MIKWFRIRILFYCKKPSIRCANLILNHHKIKSNTNLFLHSRQLHHPSLFFTIHIAPKTEYSYLYHDAIEKNPCGVPRRGTPQLHPSPPVPLRVGLQLPLSCAAHTPILHTHKRSSASALTLRNRMEEL